VQPVRLWWSGFRLAATQANHLTLWQCHRLNFISQERGANSMSRFMSTLLLICTITVGASAFAGDETVLINHHTVMAAGGFPYKITQPGHYKLSENLTVPANTDGIDILVSHVSLDLNGFSVTGPIVCDQGANCTPGTSADTHGILARGVRNITISNGHIQGFRRGLFAVDSVIEGVHASDNLQIGILAVRSLLKRNVAANNGSGIVTEGCIVTENVADGNAGAGFALSFGGVFSNNVLFSSPGSSLLIGSDVVSQHNNSCSDSNGDTNPC